MAILTPTRGSGLVAALAVVLLGAACGTSGTSSSAGPVDSAGTSSRPPAVTNTPSAASGAEDTGNAGGPVPGPSGTVTSATPRALRPVRIAVPAIGVDASITYLGIAGDGSIEVPDDADQAGWLDTTPAPGQQGPAVVAGHVDSTTGPAVFYRLGSLEVGDEVVVTRRDGSTATFTVDGVRTYPQDAFPTADVYGPVPGPALRLITCGGDYVKDAGGYQDNVVVYAS